MAVLSTLNVNKYAEHATNVSNKYRRAAEESENDLVKINHQLGQWLLGVISGDSTIQSAALTELGVIYDDTITPPTSVISSTPSTANTRIGVGVALSAGNNTVPFSSSIGSTLYSLTWNCYSASGGMVQWTQNPATRTATQFQIWVASAAKIDYQATIL